MITVAMASNGGENGPDACQQALGVRENVVVETRTCEVPNVSVPPVTVIPTGQWSRRSTTGCGWLPDRTEQPTDLSR